MSIHQRQSLRASQTGDSPMTLAEFETRETAAICNLVRVSVDRAQVPIRR